MLSHLINEKLFSYPLFRRGNQGTWCLSTLSQIVHLYNDRARIRTYSNSHDFKPGVLGSHVAICVTSGKLLNLYVSRYTSEKRIITEYFPHWMLWRLTYIKHLEQRLHITSTPKMFAIIRLSCFLFFQGKHFADGCFNHLSTNMELER